MSRDEDYNAINAALKALLVEVQSGRCDFQNAQRRLNGLQREYDIDYRFQDVSTWFWAQVNGNLLDRARGALTPPLVSATPPRPRIEPRFTAETAAAHRAAGLIPPKWRLDWL